MIFHVKFIFTILILFWYSVIYSALVFGRQTQSSSLCDPEVAGLRDITPCKGQSTRYRKKYTAGLGEWTVYIYNLMEKTENCHDADFEVTGYDNHLWCQCQQTGILMIIGFQCLDVQACKAKWGIGAKMAHSRGHYDGGAIFLNNVNIASL